jgi:hypothetical protein
MEPPEDAEGLRRRLALAAIGRPLGLAEDEEEVEEVIDIRSHLERR